MGWLELYQAEWCPHSRRVRQRLTELGVDFIARQVPVETTDRTSMRELTGVDEIPVLALSDGEIVAGEQAILSDLDARFGEPEDASAHRSKAGSNRGRSGGETETTRTIGDLR
jgi:glutathione S-transferase